MLLGRDKPVHVGQPGDAVTDTGNPAGLAVVGAERTG